MRRPEAASITSTLFDSRRLCALEDLVVLISECGDGHRESGIAGMQHCLYDNNSRLHLQCQFNETVGIDKRCSGCNGWISGEGAVQGQRQRLSVLLTCESEARLGVYQWTPSPRRNSRNDDGVGRRDTDRQSMPVRSTRSKLVLSKSPGMGSLAWKSGSTRRTRLHPSCKARLWL